MFEWLNLPKQRQIEILKTISALTGLPENAIEKDLWVTLALKSAFSTPVTEHLIFKGGTSLSKSWNLIERFSEDVDLAIDREALGFSGDLSKTQIKQLRKTSFKFVSNEFKSAVEKQILETGLKPDQFDLLARACDGSDRDPQILELRYNSILDQKGYI